MSDPAHATPVHYRSAIRTLVRFAAAMAIFGLLCGVLFQESAKQLDHAEAPGGLHLQAVLSLALVHGHVLVSATLIPIAMAAAAMLALRAGARELTPRALAWLTRGYLPCVTLAVLLMLYKGYHVLLSVRFGATDLDLVDARYFGGVKALRHAVYGVVHVGMALGLGVFCVALWRSLSARNLR
jgi:amino acid transporter